MVPTNMLSGVQLWQLASTQPEVLRYICVTKTSFCLRNVNATFVVVSSTRCVSLFVYILENAIVGMGHVPLFAFGTCSRITKLISVEISIYVACCVCIYICRYFKANLNAHHKHATPDAISVAVAWVWYSIKHFYRDINSSINSYLTKNVKDRNDCFRKLFSK